MRSQYRVPLKEGAESESVWDRLGENFPKASLDKDVNLCLKGKWRRDDGGEETRVV